MSEVASRLWPHTPPPLWKVTHVRLKFSNQISHPPTADQTDHLHIAAARCPNCGHLCSTVVSVLQLSSWCRLYFKLRSALQWESFCCSIPTSTPLFTLSVRYYLTTCPLSNPPKLVVWCAAADADYISFSTVHCSGKASAAASQVTPIHPMYQISSNHLSNPPKLSPGLQSFLVCSRSWCRFSPLFCTLAQFLQQSSQLISCQEGVLDLILLLVCSTCKLWIHIPKFYTSLWIKSKSNSISQF